MAPVDVIHKVRIIKQEHRRGMITTEQFHASMAALRKIVASRNEVC